MATENVELDCIKSRSMLYQSVQIAVPGPGTYDIEVSVSEEGKSSSWSWYGLFRWRRRGSWNVLNWE